MSSILVLYGTGEGRAAEIADRIVEGRQPVTGLETGGVARFERP